MDDTKLTCPPCTGKCSQGRSCYHSRRATQVRWLALLAVLGWAPLIVVGVAVLGLVL